MKKRKRRVPIWRAAFLRAYARTGNARASAAEAGIDPGTAYDHRIKDAGFAAQWDAAKAKAKFKAGEGVCRPGGSTDLVARRSKRHGMQMVRAGAGRWSQAIEDRFFNVLGETGCVRGAARAAGISTTALYARRRAYPEFAEKWEMVAAEAARRLPELLVAATIASFDPEALFGAKRTKRLPKVNVDQAIAISRLHGGPAGRGAGGNGARHLPRVATNEEVRAALVKRLAAFGVRVDEEARRKAIAAGRPYDREEPGDWS